MLGLFFNSVLTNAYPRSFVAGVMVLSLLGGCDRPGNQGDEQQLEAISAQLGSLGTDIERQTAVLEQILGHVSPPQLPVDWDDRLKQLEARIGDMSQWPKDAGEAAVFFDQTSELVTGLPSWAEMDYLPQLTAIRWAAMAFDRLQELQGNRHSLDQVEEIVLEARELADAKPWGGSEALAKRLRQSASEFADRAGNRRVTEAIREAQSYLGGESDGAQNIIEIYEFLELYEDADNLVGVNVNIKTLRSRLYNQVMRGQADEREAALRAQWENVRQLSRLLPLPPVYEVSVRALLHEVVSAQTALVLEGVTATAYDELESELRRAVETVESTKARRAEERQARAVRSYQRWALAEVKAFEAAFDAASRKAAEAASPLRRDDGGWNDAYYNEVRLAMINRLLPINVALLDLPVQERYQQAFQKGWKKLDGREDQTSVAQASALTIKKSLRALLEE